MLLAGVDGFQYRMYNVDPEEPIAKFFDRPRQDLAKNPSAAGALKTDHEFLLTDQLFTPGVIVMLSDKRPLLGQRSTGGV
jgi:hypothetical protein